MPEPVGPAKVHRDEHQAHDDGRHREQFAEDDQIVQFLVVVDVDRDHHHDGRGGYSDQEREVGNVNTPRYLVGHARHDEAVGELFAIGVQAQQHHRCERSHPGVIPPVTVKGQTAAAAQEDAIIANGFNHGV